MNGPTPTYKKPPIIELVCGVTFAPLERFKIAHSGLFWNRIMDQFPRCEHAPPLGDLNELMEREINLPIPRLWFINHDDDRLMQLQKNRFLFNWRKRDTSYPRFQNVYEDFSKYFGQFQEFVTEYNLGEIKILSYELTYIDALLKGEGWDNLDDINTIIPHMTWGRVMRNVLPPTENIAWQREFHLPDELGALVIKLQSGFRRPDEHPLLRLEFSARGPLAKQSTSRMQPWFDSAHKWINHVFKKMIADDVQKSIWERIC